MFVGNISKLGISNFESYLMLKYPKIRYFHWFLKVPTWNWLFSTWNRQIPTWNWLFPTWSRLFPIWNRQIPTWSRLFPTWSRKGIDTHSLLELLSGLDTGRFFETVWKNWRPTFLRKKFFSLRKMTRDFFFSTKSAVIFVKHFFRVQAW